MGLGCVRGVAHHGGRVEPAQRVQVRVVRAVGERDGERASEDGATHRMEHARRVSMRLEEELCLECS